MQKLLLGDWFSLDGGIADCPLAVIWLLILRCGSPASLWEVEGKPEALLVFVGSQHNVLYLRHKFSGVC